MMAAWFEALHPSIAIKPHSAAHVLSPGLAEPDFGGILALSVAVAYRSPMPTIQPAASFN